MSRCTRGKDVTWVINKKVVNDLYYTNLAHKKEEYSGKVVFSDSCKNGVCNKKFKDLTFSRGESESVLTPLAVINFHTHPYQCYVRENVKWGWPSGEDIRECIKFAKNGNLVHLVFSKEGTYIIKILSTKELKPKVINFIEKVLIHTHEYRSKETQMKYKKLFYKELLYPIGLPEGQNSLVQWLSFVNELTPDNLNKLYGGKLLPSGSNKLLEITLIKRTNDISFTQSYVQENCTLD
jgi:hypothetical protein